jgi:ABC-type dipeptide/oligopeptide/nickel transport system permease component
MIARLFSLLLTLLLVFAGSRALVRALPGDPLQTILAESASSLQPELIARELGLDRPFIPAVAEDLKQALRGDWGISLLSKQPIAPVLAERSLRTLELASAAAVIALAFSLLIGLSAAGRPGGAADRFCTFYGGLMASVPMPWKGPLFILMFAVWIPLFPVDRHIALPAFALATGIAGYWSRLIRARVREVLREGAAPGARARGVPEWKVLLKYGLAPGAGALLAYLGTSFGSLLGGVFVVESIFNRPGLGMLLVEGVLKRDYPLVEAGTFVAAAACLVGTWLGDLAQKSIDPRLR